MTGRPTILLTILAMALLIMPLSVDAGPGAVQLAGPQGKHAWALNIPPFAGHRPTPPGF